MIKTATFRFQSAFQYFITIAIHIKKANLTTLLLSSSTSMRPSPDPILPSGSTLGFEGPINVREKGGTCRLLLHFRYHKV